MQITRTIIFQHDKSIMLIVIRSSETPAGVFSKEWNHQKVTYSLYNANDTESAFYTDIWPNAIHCWK